MIQKNNAYDYVFHEKVCFGKLNISMAITRWDMYINQDRIAFRKGKKMSTIPINSITDVSMYKINGFQKVIQIQYQTPEGKIKTADFCSAESWKRYNNPRTEMIARVLYSKDFSHFTNLHLFDSIKRRNKFMIGGSVAGMALGFVVAMIVAGTFSYMRSASVLMILISMRLFSTIGVKIHDNRYPEV